MIPTTAVFAEILLIGFEASVWLVLLLGAIFNPTLDVESVDGWEPLVTVIIALAAYGLGVIVDRAADTMYSSVRDSQFGQRYVAGVLGKCPDFQQKPAKAGEMRMAILGHEDGRTRFLEYQRSRLRIARSTAFNLLLLMPVGGWYLLARTDIGIGVLWFEALTLLGFVGSVWASERIGDAFMDRLVDAYNLARAEQSVPGSKKDTEKLKTGAAGKRLEAESKASADDAEAAEPGACQRGAAVCYRIRRGRVKFLLVTTDDEVKRWTFPKGKIEREKDETAPQAARREAEEEAGAIGEVGSFLMTYSYPGGGRSCPEVSVEAYLLPVQRKVKPAKKERHRRRKWCTGDEAKRRLGCYRKKRFQEQHERVVDAAIARIVGPDD